MKMEDCPGCQVLAQVMRRAADSLSAGAGAVIGTGIGTLAASRTGNPALIQQGRVAGAALAPQIIERGALAIRDKVKRRQTKSQKSRSKRMSKAMKKANSKGRLKNGNYRKGWDAKRIMREAHRLCK